MLKQYAGIDIQAMYPAGAAPKADAWTLDAFLKAAEACHKGGKPFGIGLGTIILAVNVCLLASYTLGCHSIRHLTGGRIDEISKTGISRSISS
mgnify:CR=1 FL=1